MTKDLEEELEFLAKLLPLLQQHGVTSYQRGQHNLHLSPSIPLVEKKELNTFQEFQPKDPSLPASMAFWGSNLNG